MGAGPKAAFALAEAYLRTRVLHRVLTDRGRIERWQTRHLELLRRHAIARTAFYHRLGDIPFAAFPVVAKSDVMSSFADFNVLDLPASRAWRMLEQGEAPAGHDLGCSTGTSGNRGLYLVSDRERFVWLGTIVAKAIPDVLRRRHRVAIILPRATRLYEAANESRLITLRFFDLGLGLDAISKGMEAFMPTIVVGPPKALRWMAEHGTSMKPERMFASAEVLDAPDRALIEAVHGLPLGQIYMATEGLFAVTCPFGTLHLAEDAVHFEYEAVGDDPGLVAPIVTDFTRRTQVMARYRMNDLLRLATTRCRCGSALQAVTEIIGRRDDCFELPRFGRPGPVVSITPDVLRNAIIGADREIDDFRVRQTGVNAIDLVLAPALADQAVSAAHQALSAVCLQLGTQPDIRTLREALPVDTTAKLRRIERRWRPDLGSAGPGSQHAGGQLGEA